MCLVYVIIYIAQSKGENMLKVSEKKELQKQLVKLSFVKDELKKKYEEANELEEELCNKLGIGTCFQDEEGTVYQIQVPEGTFVSFKKVTFVRTRRGDEKTGSLSLKAARDMGFKVEGSR